ncbi:MAG TPA: hypothetical protein VK187_01380 [Geobacteraceae bacterium]|nr:hypothetical protein [Geobacteraceae bacterium]
MKRLVAVMLAGICVLFGAGTALGWHVSGKVLCNDPDKTPLGGVTVNVEGIGHTVTDASGFYYLGLPDVEALYTESLGDGLPPDAVFIDPSTNPFSFNITNTADTAQLDWLISSSFCQRACWLTGGGVKFNPITNSRLAEFIDPKGNKPIYSFGGNVNPGCSPVAGEGGQWNTIAHLQKLHFQGTSIQVVRCGNIAGIPEGSDSPKTPFNFIEFEGTGILKGIQGNKVDYGTVYFFARAEDRNEPGNENANSDNGGSTVDHFFLNVFSDPADPVGTSLLLVDVDGDASTIDPITITGGNLQLHISSCSK